MYVHGFKQQEQILAKSFSFAVWFSLQSVSLALVS